MNKSYRKMIFVFFLFELSFLTACTPKSYKTAKEQMESITGYNYQYVISLLKENIDYKDSRSLLCKVIEEYSDSLVSKEDYDAALSLLQENDYVSDFNAKKRSVLEKYIDYLIDDGKLSDAEKLIEVYDTLFNLKTHFEEKVNKKIEEYLSKYLFESAESIMKQCSIIDYSERINDVELLKENYEIYLQAIDCFLNKKVTEGFELLNTIPNDFGNAEKIRLSYNTLKTCKFSGTYSCGKKGKEVSGKLTFTTEFDRKDECFKLLVKKVVYWSDGTEYSNNTIYVDINDISGKTINVSKYSWTLNDEKGKSLSEKEGKSLAVNKYTK